MTNEKSKRLQHTSFLIQVTRGLIRDQKIRRRTMVSVLTAALVLIILGSTVLQKTLDPHERPGWFLFFWLACAWLTTTAILLSLFDLLMLRVEARKAGRELRDEMKKASSSNSSPEV